MKIGTFHPVHMAQLGSPEELMKHAEAFFAAGGPSWTGWEDDNRIVGCAGLAPIWKGVWEGWCILRADATPKERYMFAKAARAILLPALNAMTAHRFQATVRADNSLGQRFVEWLGLEFEGIMPQYGPDRADHCRFAWVRK